MIAIWSALVGGAWNAMWKDKLVPYRLADKLEMLRWP
jgi:hypothetical protein